MRSPSIGRRARPAYPVLLLVAALAAGCDRPEAPADAWQDPSPMVTAAQPAAPTASPATSVAPTPTPTPTPTRAATRRVFPVRAGNIDYHPTHGGYPGTDIFADCGEPVVAVTDGVVLEVSRVDRFDKRGPLGPNNGGLSVSLLGDDGVRYYGSHLSAITANVDAGVRVRAGQQLGKVGRTGNANNVCHLHFGLSPKCTGHDDWWIRRGVVWPAPYLNSWRKGSNRSPVAEVTAWQRKHGCPKSPGRSGSGG
ncbi:M23 family metallopeptidase [Micromonospora sp. WMMD1128]|uniref:M23 family metallopeptidase n=1 Tax=Micromonospora sp. WMMD1128 TaxID=3015150 RepID=UPI00248CA1A8|nr:M23 family metallopeptidase [Micromonospora sp. WMMD1128]WBB73992.1 M23 family metallopeptidase [Micromonospora sp. WMMD1128]WBB74004.1 M23 family metallopeptidase [Micromonospora sp. WMMD1128]